MNDSVFRLNCWFEGRVQGVGFRYQTMGVAKGFEVTGTIENLLDGRVHLYAEGQQAEVLAFKQEVENELEAYIRETEEKSDTGSRRCSGFRIIQ